MTDAEALDLAKRALRRKPGGGWYGPAKLPCRGKPRKYVDIPRPIIDRLIRQGALEYGNKSRSFVVRT